MRKIINVRLPFLIALSIIVGIATAYFVKMEQTFCAIFFSLIFSLLIIVFFVLSTINKKVKSSSIISILLIAFCLLGIWIFNLQINSYEDNDYGDHYYSQIVGTVEDVKPIEKGSLLIVNHIKLNDNEYKAKGKVALYYYGKTEFNIGDRIKYSGYLLRRTSTYDNRLSASYIERDIRYTSNVYDEGGVVICGEDKTIFEKINLLIKDTLERGLDGDEFSVSYALLTGNFEYIDEDVIANFRSAGVAHIFAVSGLHIGFLATALSFLFRKLKMNKYASAFITILFLFLYSGVCGFSASSIRATIMCATMLIVTLFGEKYDGLSALSISAIIILLISPVQLFCVGFQLSFMVVFGILILSPQLKRIFKFLPYKLSGNVATVLSAYLFGIPISLYAFGQFSTIAIIVNFLFIPVVGAIYIFLFLSVVLAIITTVPFIVLFPSKYILKVVVFLINVFDYEIFMVGGFSLGIFAVCYYSALIVASGFINLRKITSAILTITLLVVCVVGTTGINLYENNQTKMYVCGSDSGCFTYIDTKENDTLIISDGKSVFSAGRLRKIIEKGGQDNLMVIVQNINGIDVQVLTTRLNGIARLRKLYYYGEKNQIVENAINASFDGVHVSSYLDCEPIINGEFIYSSNLEGKCVNVKNNSIKVAVFGRLANNANYDSLNITPNIIVATDYVSAIDGKFKPDKTISYRTNLHFDNAEKHGNYACYLK